MAQQQFKKVSFYIVAHADDWQLFMQPNAYTDLVDPDTKVVFIITTAGDAGMDENFWLAREEGLKSSVRFCLAPTVTIEETTGKRKISDHEINYCSLNNMVAYFLRLPDGNLDGSGFGMYGNQSLSRFKEGDIKTITAIDSSTAYSSWFDFSKTLQAIIDLESERTRESWLHYLNPDININSNDHADHIATGNAIQSMPAISFFHQALYIGYTVADSNEGLEDTDLFWKTGMFAAYEKAVYDRSGYSTLRETISTYKKWCVSSPKFTIISPQNLHS